MADQNKEKKDKTLKTILFILLGVFASVGLVAFGNAMYENTKRKTTTTRVAETIASTRAALQ